MVVLATHQPPSGVRKNRRKMAAKKSPKSVVDQNTNHDEEMIEDEQSGGEMTIESTIPTSFPEGGDGDDELMIESDTVPSTSVPTFPPLAASAVQTTLKSETRRISIPPHRMTPLKKDWVNIFGPLTEMLGLQVRMNVQRKCVEVRVSVVALIINT